MSKTSAVDLEQAHAAGLATKRDELTRLTEYILDLSGRADEALAEWISANPGKSPDATSQAFGQRRKLADACARRDRLQAEITIQERLHSEIQDQADEERAEAERKAAETAIGEAERDLALQWADFASAAEKLRDLWPGVVETARTLDALPAGDGPITVERRELGPDLREAVGGQLEGDAPREKVTTQSLPFPADFARAVEVALTEPGEQFAEQYERLVAKRLSTTSSGFGAMNLTGYGRGARGMGDFRDSL